MKLGSLTIMPMGRVRILLTAALTALAGFPSTFYAAEHATTAVAATAQLRSRTFLTVSTQTLQFDVTAPGAPAVASVDFVAGARTRPDGEVLLTVELVRANDALGGASDVGAVVTVAGDGEGTLTGVLRSGVPVLAGRWTGSGLRAGRLRFSMNAGAGAYTLPVRFVLTAP